MTQQYSTPDGSIWERAWKIQDEDKVYFNRVAGKGWDMDFRAQKLDEVLRSWGPLSLYDPVDEQVRVLTKAFEEATWFGCKSYIEHGGGPKLFFDCLDKLGYEIVRKDRDDD